MEWQNKFWSVVAKKLGWGGKIILERDGKKILRSSVQKISGVRKKFFGTAKEKFTHDAR